MALKAHNDDDKLAWIYLGIELGISFAYVAMEYYATRPTEWQLLKMQIAQKVMITSQRITGYWWDKSIKYAIRYNELRHE